MAPAVHDGRQRFEVIFCNSERVRHGTMVVATSRWSKPRNGVSSME
jgi:hypothetical protein